MNRFSLPIALGLLLLPALSAQATVPVHYTIADIGTLGGNQSIPHDINDSGVVVGESSLSGPFGAHAFLYDGAIHDLGTLDGPYSVAFASAVAVKSPATRPSTAATPSPTHFSTMRRAPKTSTRSAAMPAMDTLSMPSAK